MNIQNGFNNEEFLIELFKKNNAILEGCFELSSGLISRKYVQCAILQKKPKLLTQIMNLLALKIKNLYPDIIIDCVVGPAIGGIIPASYLAKELEKVYQRDIETFFAEKTQDKNFEFRRGFQIEKNKNYIVMEDVITTGGSSAKVSQLIKKLGGNVLFVCSIIDRVNNLNENFKDKLVSLLKLNIETFDKENLPEDLKNIKPIKPGSSV